ncbi:MAG: nucleotidyltransferase [Lachnospiraceae bacterium]|nr:nucleotidyltransferase [Lachnospiraceae bacterium]MBQ6856542.1 nucleotidyltransferase [Lachnospiraceae bacterium]
MKKTSLVIMAAGIGSRFGGGIKQLEPVGPNGEIIMDYSIHDALEAGFDKIVFIIRKDLEKDFKEIIGKRIEKIAHVEYAFQELEDLPEGFSVPEGRKKPWGTGQAILAAKSVIHEPFLVINADDYYGKEGFRRIHDYMVNEMKEDGELLDMCMAGFVLSNTLSENGGVTRGVCTVDANGCLEKVTETYNIYLDRVGLHASTNDGHAALVRPDQVVSMNMFGLPVAFLKELENGFPEFLANVPEGNLKAEYLLPVIVDRCIREKKAAVRVLDTPDKWFGVTYKEDKPAVVTAIRKLISDGVYPDKLFG